MTIGGGIALIVIGAILAFAVQLQIAGVNLDVIGFILMAAGAVGIVLGLTTVRRARSGPVVEERRTYDDRESY